jgi:dTDP-4-amino-4,6-dideoxygalactose transaminase
MGKGVNVNVHFTPIPMLTYFKSIGYKISDYPNSYQQYACEISLPIYPQLTDEAINYIVSNVVEGVNIKTEINKLVAVIA